MGELETIPDADNALLRAIVEGTAADTGTGFFQSLVKNLATALDVKGAWVTRYLRDVRRLRALAFYMEGQWVEDYEHHVEKTPCERVVDDLRLVHIPDNILALYPDDPDIRESGMVSYMGIPFVDAQGEVFGHLAILDSKPMPPSPRTSALMRIFASRAAAELQRINCEAELRQREEKLTRLIATAFDAIVEFDAAGCITRANAASAAVFGRAAGSLEGISIMELVTPESWHLLVPMLDTLAAKPAGQQYTWLPSSMEGQTPRNVRFPLEGSLSRFESGDQAFFVLIVRNQAELQAAERRVAVLAEEAGALREALGNSTAGPEIIGESAGVRRMLAEIAQVAPTDASVLVHGETGTGKELVAAAIHRASPRRDAPLVKVNCAAVPAHLMESEFFGHEKGAFTGATQRRDGRFAVADGGTIFLDEIGELPLDLQAKLLRVLQEGEFEPLGSTRTRKVDVRVIAATNRDLTAEVAAGRFREDLYYRIGVFPIHLPPLRQRHEDILLLARVFAERFCRRQGKPVPTIDDAAAERLLGYDWPGNVRELQNVMERAVITSVPGTLQLARALPSGTGDFNTARKGADCGVILTAADMEDLERRNILRALEKAGGRISGDGGAADLLGLKPSTLTSRLKALGIRRPGNR